MAINSVIIDKARETPIIFFSPPKNLGTPAPLRAVFAERLPAMARAYPGFSLFQGVARCDLNDSSENPWVRIASSVLSARD
jgi:hypothetical protein